MTTKEPLPYASAPPTALIGYAVQAVAKGEATADQQKLALEWIIKSAALTYDLDYRADSRDHAFVSGRRFVGLQIVELLNINPSSL